MNSAEIIDRGEHNDKKSYFVLSKVNNFTKKGQYLYLELSEGKVALEFLTSNIVRVVMVKRDEELDFSSSIAVVDHGLNFNNFVVEDYERNLEIKTDLLKILINKEQFALRFYDLSGNLIHQDYSKQALGWSKDEVRVWKSLSPQERFYGLGEKTGSLDKAGSEYTMWNRDIYDPHVPSTDPLYLSIPFLISFKHGKSYGIYFDNTYKSYFDLGLNSKEYYSFGSEDGKIDYYFINGVNIKEVVKSYSDLTGKMPLPPKWSLGYHQSRYSYHPEEQVREIADNFRSREIPCDAIHLDIHYMDEYRLFAWNEEEFPRPAEMLSDLAQDGFKVVTIINPGVKKDPRYKIYQEGVKKSYFCKYLNGEEYVGVVWPGDSVYPDFTKAEVRKWWGDKHQKLIKQGVKGIWNDMNEPSNFKDGGTMELDVIHDNDGDPGTHRRFHNIYGMLVCQGTYEGYRQYSPNERPFILTRAGFAGIQRYAVVWTGDNRSFWQHLEMTMPMVMNLGLSGVSFAGSDVGGFAANSNGELLTRWTQLGVFVPFFRNHCAIDDINQEPWVFGKDYEDIIRKYIKLRYRFLTHLYNLFYQASRTGLPIMRPLVMEYPQDEKVYNLFDQFMIGDSILAAPVCKPDREKRMVYLPEGQWYDFWTGDLYQGDNYIIADAPLEIMPIFIKAGSIIPMAPIMNYVGEKKIDILNIDIYLNDEVNTNSYLLYEDDGLSLAYQDQEYDLTEFSYQYQADKLEFNISKIHQQYQLEYNSYKLCFKHLKNKPQKIEIDGNNIDKWEYSDGQLEIVVSVDTSMIIIELYLTN